MKTVSTGALPVFTGRIPGTTITTFVDTGKATVATRATLVFTVGAHVKAVFIGFLKNPWPEKSQAFFTFLNFGN